jgi:Na+/proline symporter
MQEKNRGYYQQIAQLSIIGGCIFCIAAVVIALMTLNGNALPPKLIFIMMATSTFPSLIGGFLLIMVGLILNAVVGPPIE